VGCPTPRKLGGEEEHFPTKREKRKEKGPGSKKMNNLLFCQILERAVV